MEDLDDEVLDTLRDEWLDDAMAAGVTLDEQDLVV